jgi:ferredoxin
MQSKMIGKYKVEVTEENIARVISQDGNDDDTKLLAAQSCPTAAIIVTDTSTGQQVWPRVDV